MFFFAPQINPSSQILTWFPYIKLFCRHIAKSHIYAHIICICFRALYMTAYTRNPNKTSRAYRSWFVNAHSTHTPNNVFRRLEFFNFTPFVQRSRVDDRVLHHHHHHHHRTQKPLCVSLPLYISLTCCKCFENKKSARVYEKKKMFRRAYAWCWRVEWVILGRVGARTM